MPINITCPSQTFAQDLHHTISTMIPLAHHLALDLDYLNEKCWMVPDLTRLPDSHGLASGELQLHDSTWILIDESKLEAGNLNQRGLSNILQLKETVQNALVNYIIDYGTMTRNVDFQICVLSHAKSMFGIECQIPLCPQEILSAPLPMDLPLLQRFILKNRYKPNCISETLLEKIQGDFVKEQQALRSNNLPLDDGGILLHKLALAELVSRSRGEEMTLDSWNHACKLEQNRKQRLFPTDKINR